MTGQPLWTRAIEAQFGLLSDLAWLEREGHALTGVTDRHVQEWTTRSVPFAWDEEVTQAVWRASQTVPGEARFDAQLLPDGLRSAFWWLDWPIPIPMKHPPAAGQHSDVDSEHLCAMLLTQEGDHWAVSCARRCVTGGVSRPIMLMIEFNAFTLGASLRDLAGGQAQVFDADRQVYAGLRPRDVALTRFVMAAAVWLRQRVAVMAGTPIERHARKRIARAHQVDVREVKVVTLRRLETLPRPPGPGVPVEWSCRWIVDGHWRNQYHPSTGRHELTYINPFVKGPADKPLKVPSATVYAVTR